MGSHKIIERLNKGSFVMQMAERFSPRLIREDMIKRGYVFDYEAPTVSAIADFINKHKPQKPSFLSTDRYVLIITERGLQRVVHVTPASAWQSYGDYVNDLGQANVMLCKIETTHINIKFGEREKVDPLDVDELTSPVLDKTPSQNGDSQKVLKDE